MLGVKLVDLDLVCKSTRIRISLPCIIIRLFFFFNVVQVLELILRLTILIRCCDCFSYFGLRYIILCEF